MVRASNRGPSEGGERPSNGESDPAPSLASAVSTRRPVGRPRKWADEAERKRAYRERRAADLAEPERLRRDLKAARRREGELGKRLERLERDLARAEASIDRAENRHAELRGRIEVLEMQVQFWRSRAEAH
ncbi:MAG: hypothetical protein U0Q07_08125 [Acidimicrobiales bacterium]